MASIYALAYKCGLSIADTLHTTPGVILDYQEILHPHRQEIEEGEEE